MVLKWISYLYHSREILFPYMWAYGCNVYIRVVEFFWKAEGAVLVTVKSRRVYMG